MRFVCGCQFGCSFPGEKGFGPGGILSILLPGVFCPDWMVVIAFGDANFTYRGFGRNSNVMSREFSPSRLLFQ
jgi:hypothetical protein